ncbi:MAG: hypothetical protein A2Z20_09650 [Bdellovibrionales bacterium RBG_16_40_8]|nr:MAG: hypothetical protein A2Z20_09650 [Bdellovibrionales bacterium RBG_16_40_8]
MTNSSVNDAGAEPKKSKGPIRFEAAVPIAIIFLLSYFAFHFLFDLGVKKTIEWAGIYVHGAEVNVGSFNTSFLGGSMSLKNLQVTNKENPSLNLIQIGEIRFRFLWDALLRAKFVVADAGIDKIQIYSPRKRPGYVRPPEPPEKVKKSRNVLTQAEGELTKQIEKDGSGQAISDLVGLLGDTEQKDILKNIQADLKTETTIKSLQAELKQKQIQWKERLDKLPSKDEFTKLANEAKALNFDTKNPKQFAESVKEAGRILKEVKVKSQNLKTMGHDLKEDINKYNTQFKQIDELVKEDIRNIENKLKIPNLDVKDFSKNLFNKWLAAKLGSLQKYMLLARKYMPTPKKAGEKGDTNKDELVPRARSTGKSYPFKITTGYPLFWLKKATISSETSAEGFSGQVAGALTNVTSDPAFVGKPAILEVKGNFPKSEIFDSELNLTIDHVADHKESLLLRIGSFPIADQKLVQSDDFKLIIKKAQGQSSLKAVLQNQEISVAMQNAFKNVDYDLNTKSKNVTDIISGILHEIPAVTLNANISGSWSHLNINMNSNLGSELAKGLMKRLQEKINDMKKKVHEFVNSRINSEKEKLTAEYNQLKSQADTLIKTKTNEAESAAKDVEKQASAKQSGAKNAAKKKLQDEGKKLLKGLKF